MIHRSTSSRGPWLATIFLTLLSAILAQPVLAQEDDSHNQVIYVYRTNGEVDVYFDKTVDEIRYSRLDDRGQEQTEYVAQEIVVGGQAYRTLLTDIRSVEFSHLNDVPVPAGGGSVTLNIHTASPIQDIHADAYDWERTDGGREGTPTTTATVRVTMRPRSEVCGLTEHIYVLDSGGEEYTASVHQTGTGVFEANMGNINYELHADCAMYDSRNEGREDMPAHWTENVAISNRSNPAVPITMRREKETLIITGGKDFAPVYTDNDDETATYTGTVDWLRNRWTQHRLHFSLTIDVSEAPMRILDGDIRYAYKSHEREWGYRDSALFYDTWQNKEETLQLAVHGGEQHGAGLGFGSSVQHIQLGKYHNKEVSYRYDDDFVEDGNTTTITTDAIRLPATDDDGSEYPTGVGFTLWQE